MAVAEGAVLEQIVFGVDLVQPGGQPLGEATGIGEDDGRAVGLDRVDDGGLDVRPQRAGGRREVQEGGTGHSLEDLTRKHIDVAVADSVKTLMKELAATTKSKVGEIWKTVELDNPQYLLYAGMDPILAARLYGKLVPLVPAVSVDLIDYEHTVAQVCASMERTGFLLDTEYTKDLAEKLHCAELDFTWKAGQMGCENVNSTDQVAQVDRPAHPAHRSPTCST